MPCALPAPFLSRRAQPSTIPGRPQLDPAAQTLAAPGIIRLRAVVNAFDFAARANPEYVDALYRQYRQDPGSVDERWALIFAGYDFAIAARSGGEGGSADSALLDLVHSYRELGHLVADLDPLGQSPRVHPLLRLEEFGFGEGDLERRVRATSF